MKYTVGILILFLCSSFVIAQAQVPVDVSTTEHRVIQQEHQVTRKFFSDEFQRQRNELLDDFDERGKYYEGKFDQTISSTVWKLSLLWSGIVFVAFGLTSVFRVKKETKRFNILRKSTKDYVMGEIKKEKFKEDEQKISKFMEPEVPKPPPVKRGLFGGMLKKKDNQVPIATISPYFEQNYWVEVGK